MPLNEEFKIDAWNVPEFDVAYKASLASTLFSGALPPNVVNAISRPGILDLVGGQFIDKNNTNIRQVNSENGFAFGVDKSVKTQLMATQAEVKDIKDYIDSISKNCLTQASSRGDIRIKQYYTDAAFALDSQNGNLTEALFTSPYINGLLDQRISLTNPVGLSSESQKQGLTVPLYEAIYDFNHATMRELAVEYRRQKNEKEGWSTKSESEYLGELHKAHSNLLEQYNKLSKFKDDPQENTAHFTQDKLEALFGTGSTERKVSHIVGIVRGEKRAIENGWGKDDLFILGIIGGIEEEMKYQASRNLDEDFKKTYPQFKSDFMKLKNECFYSTVSSPAEKLAIAAKVNRFIEKQNSVAAQSCLKTMRDFKDKFNRVHKEISEEVTKIELKNEADVPFKSDIENIPNSADNNILDEQYEEDIVIDLEPKKIVNTKKYQETGHYLIDKFNQGIDMDYYGFFAREYIDIAVKMANDSGAKQAKLRLNAATERILNETPAYVLLKVRKALVESYLDLVVACHNEEEQLAEDIREGRVEVPAEKLPSPGAFKDYTFSRAYAKHMLSNSELNQKCRAAKNVCGVISAHLSHLNDFIDIKDSYIKNSPEGMDEGQLRIILQDPFRGINDHSVNDYTITNNIKAEENEFQFDASSFANKLNQVKTEINNYKATATQLQSDSNNLYLRAKDLGSHKPTAVYKKELNSYVREDNQDTEINPKNANSQAYMNLINALSRVNNLSNDNSPREHLEAYRNLRDASKAYNDKIDARFFAGRRENGKQRRRLSGEAYTFAENAISQLESIPESMDMNVSLEKQLTNATTVINETKADFKAKINENLAKEKADYTKKCFVYDPNKGLDENRKVLINGMAIMLVIHTLKDLNSNKGEVVPPDFINHKLVVSKHKTLMTTAQFERMKNSIKSEQEVKDMMTKLEENPDYVLEEYNKFRDEPVAANNKANKAKNEPEISNNNNIQVIKN